MQRLFVLITSAWVCGLLLTGCHSGQYAKRTSMPDTQSIEGQLRAGDLVSVVFSGVPKPPERYEGRIKEDGYISLPLVGSVLASGKTIGEVEQEIHDLYVPKYFLHLTVNVNSENRYFYVDREVRNPNRYVYVGQLTVLQAIASAGGFTDFANKKKVQLIRANGERFTVNWVKAQENPIYDLPVYPGDKIIVPRRFTGQ